VPPRRSDPHDRDLTLHYRPRPEPAISGRSSYRRLPISRPGHVTSASDGNLQSDDGSTGHADGIGPAIDNALSLLAELAHPGGRHLPPTYPDRLHQCATTFTTIGLRRCGQALDNLARARDAEDLLGRAWIDAHIRLMVAADNR
jgi:hypothetical protein